VHYFHQDLFWNLSLEIFIIDMIVLLAILLRLIFYPLMMEGLSSSISFAQLLEYIRK